MNTTSALFFILSFMRNYFTQNFPFHFSYTIYNCNTYRITITKIGLAFLHVLFLLHLKLVKNINL